MSVPSDMQRFEFAPTNLDISRSVFNRNHSFKASFNVGDVIPFELMEILPGDTVSIDTSKVVRVQPMVTPIMDELYLDTYYFFVPNRLVWNHWKEFMGENSSGPWTPTVEYSIPQVAIPTGGFDVGTIADYFGVPPKMGAGKKISALPFRAYARIMDEWFRSESNQTPVNVPMDDSDITGVNTGDQVTDICKGGKPFIACKLVDYFTSCLPSPQRGPAVTLPLNDIANVVPASSWDVNSLSASLKHVWTYDSNQPSVYFGYQNDASLEPSDVKTFDYSRVLGTNYNSSRISSFLGPTTDVATVSSNALYPLNLVADLSNATASTVNELRQAFAIQKYYEKSARGGGRYIEMIKSFFGVTSPDARLQRSEFLGGNRVPLNVNQVEQTSATETGIDTPQGNVVGMSLTGDNHSDFTKSFTEHGYIIGVAVVRYHHSYQQGLERHWSRKTIFDYYNPVFASLGEMSVKSEEVYFDADPDDVFGYQEAWADYRYAPSRIAGEMRSVHSTSLDMWHLADYYASTPQLGDVWIREDKSNLDRCLAVTSSVSNQLIADFYIQCHAVRPMPLYSIPGLIDHH